MSEALLAAVEVGALVAKTVHQMEVLWLLGGHSCEYGDYGVGTPCWEGLSLEARSLGAVEDARNAAMEIVRTAQRKWNNWFLSEYHQVGLSDANHRVSRPDHTWERARHEVASYEWSDCLLEVSMISAELEVGLLTFLSEPQKMCFNLSKHINQACYPVPSYRYLSGSPSEKWMLPRLPLALSPSSTTVWREEAMTRFAELDLDFPHLDYSSSTPNQLMRTLFDSLSNQLVPPENSVWQSTPVGLDFLGDHSGRIRNTATGIEVAVSQRQQFCFIKLLAESGQSPVSRSRITEYWEQTNGTDCGDEPTWLDNALRRARRPLAELGMAIQNHRNTGWMIITKDDQP